MRKVMALVVSIVMVLSLMMLPVSAEGYAVSVGDATGKFGQDVTVTVSIDTDACTTASFILTYDTALTFKDYEVVASAFVVENEEDAAYTVDTETEGQIAVVIIPESAVSFSGAFIDFTFTAPQQADSDPVEYTVATSAEDNGFIDGGWEPVESVSYGSAKVTISSGPSIAISDLSSAAVVGDKLAPTVTPSEEMASLNYEWARGDEVVATTKDYTATAADRDQTLTFTAKGETKAEGEPVEKSVEVNVSKNNNAPTVEITGDRIYAGKENTIEYDFADENGFGDASEVKVEVADTEDGVYEKDLDGVYISYKADTENHKVIITATDEALDKFVKITVKAANDDEDIEKTLGEEVSVIIKVTKKSGSAKTIGGGASLVNKGKDNTDTDKDNDGDKDNNDGQEGSKKPGPKESIVLTIGDKEASKFGEIVTNDVAPVIRENRTMLPARFVAEALGAKVAWDDATKTVTVVKDNVSIILVIGSDIAIINGEEVKIDSPAFIENDRTYTPIRVVAEALGANVDWDDAAKSAIITPVVK